MTLIFINFVPSKKKGNGSNITLHRTAQKGKGRKQHHTKGGLGTTYIFDLTFPYLTLPYLTLPYLTLPYLTLPYLTLPYLTLPYLTLPYLTSPHLTLPYLTSPHLTSPHLTSPHLYRFTPFTRLSLYPFYPVTLSPCYSFTFFSTVPYFTPFLSLTFFNRHQPNLISFIFVS